MKMLRIQTRNRNQLENSRWKLFRDGQPRKVSPTWLLPLPLLISDTEINLSLGRPHHHLRNIEPSAPNLHQQSHSMRPSAMFARLSVNFFSASSQHEAEVQVEADRSMRFVIEWGLCEVFRFEEILPSDDV